MFKIFAKKQNFTKFRFWGKILLHYQLDASQPSEQQENKAFA